MKAHLYKLFAGIEVQRYCASRSPIITRTAVTMMPKLPRLRTIVYTDIASMVMISYVYTGAIRTENAASPGDGCRKAFEVCDYIVSCVMHVAVADGARN